MYGLSGKFSQGEGPKIKLEIPLKKYIPMITNLLSIFWERQAQKTEPSIKQKFKIVKAKPALFSVIPKETSLVVIRPNP